MDTTNNPSFEGSSFSFLRPSSSSRKTVMRAAPSPTVMDPFEGLQRQKPHPLDDDLGAETVNKKNNSDDDRRPRSPSQIITMAEAKDSCFQREEELVQEKESLLSESRRKMMQVLELESGTTLEEKVGRGASSYSSTATTRRRGCKAATLWISLMVMILIMGGWIGWVVEEEPPEGSNTGGGFMRSGSGSPGGPLQPGTRGGAGQMNPPTEAEPYSGRNHYENTILLAQPPTGNVTVKETTQPDQRNGTTTTTSATTTPVQNTTTTTITSNTTSAASPTIRDHMLHQALEKLVKKDKDD